MTNWGPGPVRVRRLREDFSASVRVISLKVLVDGGTFVVVVREGEGMRGVGGVVKFDGV